MNEQEIEKLIMAEQRRRQLADKTHLQQLAYEQSGDLRRWSARRRMVVRLMAVVFMLAIPSAYAMILPQREAKQVICNLHGDEQLVLNRACSSVGICENRPVVGWMQSLNIK